MNGMLSMEDKRRIVAQNIDQLQPIDEPWEEAILVITFPDGTVFRANGLSLNYLNLIKEVVGGEIGVKKVIVQRKGEES